MKRQNSKMGRKKMKIHPSSKRNINLKMKEKNTIVRAPSLFQPMRNYGAQNWKDLRRLTMYDFHDSTDTVKFRTEKQAINKIFCFSSDFDETWWSCSYPCVLQFHQVLSKSDEKQKSFINCPFFCSEFQSVSRIVKIVHSAIGSNWQSRLANLIIHPQFFIP